MNEFKSKKMTSHKEPVQIFSGSTWEAEMLKSLLESEGITGYLLNEAGTVFPFETTETGSAAVRVMVDPADFETAKIVAENYRSNSAGSRD